MKNNFNRFNRCAALLFFTLSSTILATNYYVSSTGNDNNAGTSTTAAWKTLSKINNTDLNAGDKVFLEGGSQFAGALKLTSTHSGTSGNPVIINSYGTGRATIKGAKTTDCIWFQGAQYIEARNLNLVGSGVDYTTKVVSDAQGIHCSDNASYITVDSMTITQSSCGVYATKSNNLRFTHVIAKHNAGAGFYVGGPLFITGPGIDQGRSSNIYIGYCVADSNEGDPNGTTGHSGHGIYLNSTDGALVEYCTAGWNAGKEGNVNAWGPVAMWCEDADRVIFQYCIAHDQKSKTGDGGAYDFDGWTTNSVIQYCYSYNCKSSSVLFWHYGTKASQYDTVRYNIFMNDGLSGEGSIRGNDDNTSDIQIYNNLIVHKNAACVNMTTDNTYCFRNNIFICGSGNVLDGTSNTAKYQGNCYWQKTGTFNPFGVGGWAQFQQQYETVGGQATGYLGDPKLLNATQDYIPLTDPTQLASLAQYYGLQTTSPCIDKGLDLHSLFGTNVGTRDIIGTSIPQNTKFDMGPLEKTGTVSGGAFPTVATAASANPSTVTATTSNLSVLGADDGGEANLVYTWATAGTPPAAVTFSANGTNAAKNTTANFIKNGTYTLQASIRDQGGQTVTSSVNVTVNQTLTTITVSPLSANVVMNATQQFTATAKDQFGAALVSQPAFTWSVSGGGTINTSGLFTAGATAGGPYTATAASGGKSGTASITVAAAVSTRIMDSKDASGITITGTWADYALPSCYGTDTKHDNNTSKGSCTVRYTPNLSGSYKIYEWHGSYTGGLATSVPHVIQHATGSQTITVNQNTAGGVWNLLGTFTLNSSSYVQINNSGTSGYVVADGIKFELQSGATAPSITTQPASQTVTVGTSVTFSVVASGTAPLAYQWQMAGVNVSGATSASYTLASAQTTDAGSYTCYVSNSAGNVTSNAATLTVNTVAVAPSITTQPASQTVNVGSLVTFSVVASGTAPLSYQWKKAGVNISGATSASYTLASAQTTDAGSYTCYVSNSTGNVTSNAATLTVNSLVTKIMDSKDASGITITGTWFDYALPSCNGPDTKHDDNASKGSKNVRYTPNVTGTFKIYEWHGTYTGGLATSVPHVIQHASGSQTVNVNQNTAGGQWNLVGTFTLNSSSYVQINNASTSGYVVADGIRFVQQ